jgi:hypothetical protein
MTSILSSRGRRTASIRSGRAGGLAGEVRRSALRRGRPDRTKDTGGVDRCLVPPQLQGFVLRRPIDARGPVGRLLMTISPWAAAEANRASMFTVSPNAVIS